MELTQKQQEFIENYANPNSDTFGNGLKSYLKAGYKETPSAQQSSCRLLTSDKVKQALIEYKAKRDRNREVIEQYTIEQYRSELDKALALATKLNQPSAAVSAIVAKGRSCGYDKDHVQTEDKTQPNIDHDTLKDIEAYASKACIKLASG